MRHWSRIATRNWRAKRLRTAGAVLAIALGTGAVVWVTCCYESVRRAVMEWAQSYVGNAHVTVQSPLDRYDTIPENVVRMVDEVAGVAHAAPVLVQRLPATVATNEQMAATPAGQLPDTEWNEYLDVHGIDLAREPGVRDWATRIVPGGRMLRADDELACVLEESIAREQGIDVGDTVILWPGSIESEWVSLEVVGLVERRRIAHFVKGIALVRLPVLQQLCSKQTRVTSVDVVLAEPTKEGVQRTAAQIFSELRGRVPNAQVRSVAARLAQVEKAQEQQEVVLLLLSCVAMLTALFIILSTLSMGMVERIGQMGLLRCVGTTRWQLAALTMTEVFPLGVIGIVLGVPIGLGLTALTVWLVPEYVGAFVVSLRGIASAGIAGLVTALFAAALPALAAVSVSPLEAARPRARQPKFVFLVVSFVLAVAALGAQYHIVEHRVQRDLDFIQWSATAVVLLYLGYALAAPLLVWVVSRLAVPIVALLVGVRLRLLQDQVGRAVWRSAGICCGLMVGLSLIVGLVVFNRSFRSGWQFPKQFPEAYIWSFEQIDANVDRVVETVGGVEEYTAANAVNVIVEERPVFYLEKILRSITWFLGIEPDSFLDMVELKFIEGDPQRARELLRQGGHVLIAADFARTRHKGVHQVRDEDGNVIVDNTVRVLFNNRWYRFKVAGVIDSPALDIAAGYFQVESQAHLAASGSVIGTNADMQRMFGVSGVKLILLNFDLPPTEPPPDWEPPSWAASQRRPSDRYYNESLSDASRYQYYREIKVLLDLRRELAAWNANYGTARELKDEIDQELTRMTYLLTAVPAVALLVAAIGVANLMTANVASREKQIAIMRAVGATRSQVLRMVIGEALVLGLLGSALGMGLGLHLAWNTTAMTYAMWGFDVPFTVPWAFVLAAAALTIGLCIIAGVAPARHAARTNVIDALHVS